MHKTEFQSIQLTAVVEEINRLYNMNVRSRKQSSKGGSFLISALELPTCGATPCLAIGPIYSAQEPCSYTLLFPFSSISMMHTPCLNSSPASFSLSAADLFVYFK